MKRKATIIFRAGIITLFCISISTAQDEQWLQYHNEREADRIVGDMRSAHLTMVATIAAKREHIQLPQAKSGESYFAKWSTPMVDSGYLWMALERTSKSGPWDRLYIDSNANGQLDDETAVAA